MVAGVGDEAVQPVDEARHQAGPSRPRRARARSAGDETTGRRLELALEDEVDGVPDRADDELPVDVPDRPAVEPASERDRRQRRQRRQRRIGNHLDANDTAFARPAAAPEAALRAPVGARTRSPGGKPIESRTRGVLRRVPAVPPSHDERRLDEREALVSPRQVRGKVLRAGRGEEGDERRLSLPEDDVASPEEDEALARERLVGLLPSRDRPDEREEAARGEVPARGGGVGRDRPAQRDPGRDGLRVARLRRRPRLEVRGRPEDEVEGPLALRARPGPAGLPRGSGTSPRDRCRGRSSARARPRRAAPRP